MNWEEIKLSLFADNMVIYTETFKELTKILLRPICNYSKFAEYKLITQKSLASFYTSSKQLVFEIKNTILFILAPK